VVTLKILLQQHTAEGYQQAKSIQTLLLLASRYVHAAERLSHAAARNCPSKAPERLFEETRRDVLRSEQ